MKKILLTSATVMLCFLISCKDTSTTSSTDTSQNDKNLENNKKIYHAIETGDAATIDSLIASDAIDHEGPSGMDVKGTDSVRHMLVDMHNHVKDLKLESEQSAANGDYIFSLAHITGTANDDSWGMPAGSKIDQREVDVIKLKDGKMMEHWGFMDSKEMMKHMKDMPPMDNGKMDKMMSKDSMKK